MPGALPTVAFIALVLALVPLALHWRSRNVPLLSIMAWLAMSDLIYGTNSTIWNGNVDIVAPVWCDISTKLRVGSEIALSVCTLALALQVYRVTLQKSRLGLAWQLGICLGFPLIIMGLHSIVQGHRFDIYEDFGCNPAIYLSVPSIIILDVPPLVAAALALVYCSLALVNFSRQRKAFSRIVRDAHSPGLSKSRYFRVMSLTFSLGLWNALVLSLTRASAYRNGLLPWTTWDDVHSYFFLVSQYPTALIPSDVLGWLYFNWSSVPISIIFVFAFFGFGTEAVTDYRACARWFEKTILRQNTGSPSSESPGQSDRSGSVQDKCFT
ncbi:GPCR fungal pheromone mating factor [Mycena rosella]|uniref:GPCR fungal pheromone mating factor n=1 Tax=Mycena rosella TaxID=1033263 RepID=A0AAD7G3G9_MYCRO|nr:GPCR fungal pheromone mating factor [Mycena rosella]